MNHNLKKRLQINFYSKMKTLVYQIIDKVINISRQKDVIDRKAY